ncbi:cyclin-D5-2-like [Curcuma longa]|uniref:cyclin-D5-2-like n=1 Tax=Curcuma longa TaxID=136217 RepID=UPI003D9EDDD6
MGESAALLCDEDDASCVRFSLTDVAQLHQAPADSDEDDYVRKLEARDSVFSPQRQEIFSSRRDCFSHARSDAIRWILRTKFCFGFSFRTAYLAVTYFDRFLAQRSIGKGKPWAVRLLSLASVSVAAKMEECSVPTLVDLQSDGFSFDASSVQRMELLLLDTLQWRMNSVTPFDYFTYFVSKFQCDSSQEELLCRAIDFIFRAIDVINLPAYRSSAIIAAAAILAASSKLYSKETLESKISTVSMFGSCTEKEHVFFCYKIMTQDPSKKDDSMRRTSSNTDASGIATSNSSRNERRKLCLADQINWRLP